MLKMNTNSIKSKIAAFHIITLKNWNEITTTKFLNDITLKIWKQKNNNKVSEWQTQ